MFVPFKVMFPDDNGVFDIPVVEVSISSDLRPETEYEIGKALKALRYVSERHGYDFADSDVTILGTKVSSSCREA